MANNMSITAQDYLNENAEGISKSLALFHESALLFSSPELINKFENKWVAAHDGEVVAVADTIDSLITMMLSKGVSPQESMVRHIDREQKTFIL
jgi:hypothetical protein